MVADGKGGAVCLTVIPRPLPPLRHYRVPFLAVITVFLPADIAQTLSLQTEHV
jgi:hypothetical protein